MCGQLKTFIHGILPNYTEINHNDLYFIATCVEDDKNAISSAIQTVNGLIDCLEDVELKEVVYGTGLYDVGEVTVSKAYKEAYEIGKNV